MEPSEPCQFLVDQVGRRLALGFIGQAYEGLLIRLIMKLNTVRVEISELKARITYLHERMTSLSSDSCFSGGNLCRRLDITEVDDDIVTHVKAEAAVAVASLQPVVVALARLGQHKQNNSQSGLPIGLKRREDKYFLLGSFYSALYTKKMIIC